MKKPTIQFIITGGTIDSYYEGTKDTVVPHKTSVIPQFINSLKLYEETIFTEICMKDSRDLLQENLKIARDTIENSPHKLIILPTGLIPCQILQNI